MKYRMATTIANLDIELLITILSLLGKTCNGAASFARAMAVCRLFREAAKNVDDLSDFCFRNIEVLDRYREFQERKGLIYHCAQAGNESAQYLLAQVILPTCTQLLNIGVPKEKLNNFRDYNPEKTKGKEKYRAKALAASFLCHFNVRQESKNQNPESSTSSLSHRKLVRVFLNEITTSNLTFIIPHLRNYITYFMGKATYGTEAYVFLHFISTLCSVAWQTRGSCLVFYQGYFYVKGNKDELIIPPPQLGGLGWNEEFIDWEYSSFVFALVKRQAIFSFDKLQ